MFYPSPTRSILAILNWYKIGHIPVIWLYWIGTRTIIDPYVLKFNILNSLKILVSMPIRKTWNKHYSIHNVILNSNMFKVKPLTKKETLSVLFIELQTRVGKTSHWVKLRFHIPMCASNVTSYLTMKIYFSCRILTKSVEFTFRPVVPG